MEFPLVALAIIVVARVLDLTALRAVEADARARIEAALLQARMLSLGALVLALAAGAVAYMFAPDIPAHIVILGILVASILAQALVGGVALARAHAQSRYTLVFVVSRLVTAGAIGVLLTS